MTRLVKHSIKWPARWASATGRTKGGQDCKEGNPHAIEFPRAKVEGSPYDFSFSGLKSAVLNYINKAHMTGEEINVPDLVASFQNAVVEALVSRAILAAKEYGYDKLAIAGGVASNSALRAAMQEACDEAHIRFYHPSPIFCTDNAAMIGCAAYYEYKEGNAPWLGLKCGSEFKSLASDNIK